MWLALLVFPSLTYQAKSIDDSAISTLLQFIPPFLRCTDLDLGILSRPFTLDDIQSACYTVVLQKSSPGLDGFPYDILRLLLSRFGLSNLVPVVYNQVLHNIFPSSWHQSCVTLLPKKGDRSLLANWRPISLIYTDAKIFTRLITQ
ncbi:hypothetical protein BC941DRAFT_486573, partial [Chlamydoabsidia padenii]